LRRIVLFLSTALAALLLAPGAALAAQVTVSLTFDDGWDTQQTAATMLAAHGLKGTFYVNSPNIGQSGYLTWAQLTTFNVAGNEIGGHTLTHPDLTTLTATQAQHEICDDRTNIQSHGFVVPDFAYPFGAYDSNTGAGALDVSSIVKNCGYASGRGAFGLHNITATNDTRAYATSILPPNLYKILIPCCINYASFGGSTPTAAALESYIQHAQAEASPNPGWVIFFFHRICDNCGGDTPAPAISPTELNALLDWLPTSGVTVKTVAQVIKNDTQAPASSIACGGTTCSSGWYTGPVSVSLSATDTGPSGVAMIRYTTDGSDPTAASPLYTGPFTVSATTTVKYRAWDNANNIEATKSRAIQIDTTPPASSIACNLSVCSTGWYGAAVSVSLSATDADSGVAAIRYTTDGTDPTTSSTLYTTPFTVPVTTTVKYRAFDNAGNVEATNSQLIQIDTTPPTSSITCNGATCSSGWYTAPVSVALSAVDAESGVAAIRYTTDGSDPTAASPAYTGPFTVSATTTIKYRAFDNAGNAEPINSQLIRVDTTAPISSIACGGAACSNGWYGGPVSVSLSATDADSGVASIRYTTDGSDPTASSLAYTAPFTVSATTTVKYRAFDNAGNAEATNSQLVQIDTTAPTSSISCGGAGCSSGWYGGPVSVSLSATDADSGVASIRYTTDGSDPTAASLAYTAPFTVSATTTVKYRAFDNAGNAESTSAQVIQVDTTAPVSSISCNSSPCSGWYGGPVSVSLAATDTESGVATIRYTTDGTDPTASSPAYTAPFTVSATTTVKFRAWDNVGNVEATNSQLIQIDTTAPTSSIACNGSACSSAAYSADVTVTLSASDVQSGVSVIRYTLDGSNPTVSSTAYSDPITVSQTTTVKYRAWDNAGNVEATNSQLITITKPAPDTTPPTSSIACNLDVCSTGWYGAAVSVSLSAADAGSGVAAIRYTTDGTDPTTSSTLYTVPFTVLSTTTVKYRAWDNAGNVEATNSQLIRIDTTAPSSSISCNGSSCSSGWYNASVSVALSAADSQSGVAVIRYTTDGTDPTTSSPAYVGPFTVSATTTVKYRAWDNVGNAEGTRSQLIQIDTTTPTSSITCNGAKCSTGWYKAAVTVALSATDTGSGVAVIRYTTDGSVPTASSPAYSAPFSVSSTATVRYRAWDVAGNVEATKSQLIQIDTTAPTVAITSPANGARVSGNVKVTATAADAGSGVAQVSFYADGVLIGTSKGPSYSVTWNTNKVSKAQHTLTAVAQDVAGNSQTSAAILVTVT
jgi:peptidoglycan/xylan/chitin deacetylase (PgdA/CDA1 family)/N-acetyl-beta-hexosaminidase